MLFTQYKYNTEHNNYWTTGSTGANILAPIILQLDINTETTNYTTLYETHCHIYGIAWAMS